MQFDYEIPIDEFVAAQVLYGKGRFVKQAITWLLLGLLLVLIALSRRAPDWGSILLVITSAWFVYAGMASFFPTRFYRRAYSESGLAGKNYHAELNESGFSVNGNSCSWQVPWAEVRIKREDDRVFMFLGKGTIFIFGKRYLTDEQQKEVRQFAAIP